MPLMKVRKEDDTGWYTVDHLNFNYLGLGINEPITLVQSNNKAENLNKIYVYKGKNDYPYNGEPQEELLYKSTMLNELKNNWMPKLLEYSNKEPIPEDQQKNINITDSKVYPGEPGTLLLEHRTIIKNKTTQGTTGGTNTGGTGTNTGETPACSFGIINEQYGTDTNSPGNLQAKTDYFNTSTIKKVTPVNSSITYKIHAYKNNNYIGVLYFNKETEKYKAAKKYEELDKDFTGWSGTGTVPKGDYNNDIISDYKTELETSGWPSDYEYRLCGTWWSSNGNPNFWGFTLQELVEEPSEEGTPSTPSTTETFHILNYWDVNNKKWVPLNNIWG